MATQFYLRDAAATIAPGTNTYKLLARETRGSAAVEYVTATIAGPVTPPTEATQVTKTSGGAPLMWLSEPLAAVTIASTITLRYWCNENNALANAALGYEVYRCDTAGNILSTICVALKNKNLTEVSTTAGGASYSFTQTPTSTAIAEGERIGVRGYIFDANTVTMASGYEAHFWLDGTASGAQGDTRITFTETVTLSTGNYFVPTGGIRVGGAAVVGSGAITYTPTGGLVNSGTAPNDFTRPVYYVKNGGNNASDGLSDATAWATVAKVNSTVVAGDTVRFKRGSTWAERLIPVSGINEAHRTIYEAYDDTSFLFDNSSEILFDNSNVVDYSTVAALPKLNCITIDAKSYITIQYLETWGNSYNYPLGITGASHHINVFNNYIWQDTAGSTTSALCIQTGSYCKIQYNTIKSFVTGSLKDAMLMQWGCTYNVISYNTFNEGPHYAFSLTGGDGDAVGHANDESNYNYIGYNTVDNPTGDGMQVYTNSNWNIVEFNNVKIHDAVLDGYPTVFKLLGSYNIFRRNIIQAANTTGIGRGINIEPYTFAVGWPQNSALYMHIYNNIIHNVYGNETNRGALHLGTAGSPGDLAYNIFKNNIIYGNTIPYEITKTTATQIHDNKFINNLIFRNGVNNIIYANNTPRTVAAQETADALWTGNLTHDPELNADYTPTSTSYSKNKGAHLTFITSTGNTGNSFVVDDPGYFHDGYGIPGIQGDWIRIGSQSTQITGINYGTKTITVSGNITWNQNDNVDLLYSGTAPDLGVFEYEEAYTPSGIVCGGALTQSSTFNLTVSGGINFGGTNTWKVTSSIAGGSIVGGTIGTNLINYTMIASGGMTIWGVYSISFTSIGGIRLAGTGIGAYSFGGIVLGGNAAKSFNVIHTPSGGETIEGFAPFVIGFNTFGGSVIGGFVTQDYYHTPSRGAVCSNSVTNVVVANPVDGGLVVEGTAEKYAMVAEGGIAIEGSAPYTIAFLSDGGIPVGGINLTTSLIDHIEDGGIIFGGSGFNIEHVPTGGIRVSNANQQATIVIDPAYMGGIRTGGNYTQSFSYSISGGAVVNGTVENAIVHTVTGGLVVSGYYTSDYISTVDGGAVVGGNYTYEHFVIGGLAISNSAIIISIVITSVSGIRFGGTNTNSVTGANITTGGTVFGGNGIESLRWTEAVDGGFIFGGVASVRYGFNIPSGIRIGGTNAIVIGSRTSGGTVVNGQAQFAMDLVFEPIASLVVGGNNNWSGFGFVGQGGTVIQGSAINIHRYISTVSGGSIAGGQAPEDITSSVSGGFRAGGHYAMIAEMTAEGGIAVGSQEVLFTTITSSISGGSVQSGAATIGYKFDSFGGVTLGGNNQSSIAIVSTVSGGIRFSGSSLQALSLIEATAGGIIIQGAATYLVFHTGCVVSGVTKTFIGYQTFGGIATGGNASFTFRSPIVGGMNVGGNATFDIFGTERGVIFGGSTITTKIAFLGTGGINVSGSSPLIQSLDIYYISSGGTAIGGEAPKALNWNQIAVSGCIIGGVASWTSALFPTGIILGSGSLNQNIEFINSSGIAVKGDVVVSVTVVMQSSNGSVFGGTNRTLLKSSVTGGAIVSNNAIAINVTEPCTGGAIASSETNIAITLTTSGGLAVTGTANISSGGIVFGGRYGYNHIVTGGTVVSNDITLINLTEPVSGGSVHSTLTPFEISLYHVASGGTVLSGRYMIVNARMTVSIVISLPEVIFRIK